MKQRRFFAACAVASATQLSLAAAADGAMATARTQARFLAQIELALDAMGYSIDPPDGLPDARTTAALAMFLERLGLPDATPIGGALAATALAAADLQRAERLVRAELRRDAEERMVRQDLARPTIEQLAVATPSASQ